MFAIVPSAVLMIVRRAASSFATNRRVPSWLTATCSGSGPLVSTRTSLRAAMSTTPMPSALRSGGGSVFSSTPGGADGEPLSATYRSLPSGLAAMPRGRFPSAIVPTTACVAASMIERSPDASLVT